MQASHPTDPFTRETHIHIYTMEPSDFQNPDITSDEKHSDQTSHSSPKPWLLQPRELWARSPLHGSLTPSSLDFMEVLLWRWVPLASEMLSFLKSRQCAGDFTLLQGPMCTDVKHPSRHTHSRPIAFHAAKCLKHKEATTRPHPSYQVQLTKA